MLKSVKSYLGKCIAIKDLGEATFILGIKIYRDRSKQLIRLSQSAYMDKILKRFRMDNSKRGKIPMQERLDLNKSQGASTPEEVKHMQNVPYLLVVGFIINTKDMFLVYGGNLEAELRVTFYLYWKHSRQSTIAMSATEAEYIAASEAAMKVVWIKKFISGLGEWLKFNKCDFSLDSRKEFKKRLMEIQRKEIERSEALDIEEFAALHEGIALQNLNQFCHVSFRQGDRSFTSQAWNRDSIVDLDNMDTMVFQLGGENRPHNYGPTEYVVNITTRDHYDTRHPPSYTSVRSPIRRLVHRLLALSVVGRHSGKEKVTLDDLFLLHSMDGGVSVDVPWHVAKFFIDKEKGYKKKSPIIGAHLIGRNARSFGLMASGALRGVTLGPETFLLGVAKLVELGICKYNALGYGEMDDDVPEVARDEGAGAGMEQANVGGEMPPNMTTTNMLRAMDERLGDIETDISRLAGDVDELTYVVSGMSEQYDQCYGEFEQWKMEQERFLTWNTDHLSQLLAHHHIDHTRYDGTPYAYFPDIPDLGVQQGVNFMSSTPIYSTAPSPSPNLFGFFGDANAFEYRVLIDLILHRSSINNSASLSNKFGGFYFCFKFGISGLLHHVVTAIADRKRGSFVKLFVKLFVGIFWKAKQSQGGSPTGIHDLFSGRYCGLAGRMVTLRASTAGAKGGNHRELGTIETSYKSLLGNHVSFMRILGLREVARTTARIALEFAPDYAFSVSLLLTPLCCDDIHDVTPRVSALAGCDRLVSEPMVIEN
ncbi:hypothetical protein Tco_1316403 [Tanacetum coccineum]